MESPYEPHSGSSIPIEPDIQACLKHGWNQMLKYPGQLFVILLIFLLFNLPSQAINLFNDLDDLTDLAGYFGMLSISLVYSIFVLTPLSYGSYYVYLKVARDIEPRVSDLFEGFKVYLNVIIAAILMGLIIFGGTLLLILPGIYFAIKLTFVPFLVIDKRLSPMQAIQRSWDMTKGHELMIVGFFLVGILIGIAGLLALIVGVFVAIVWLSIAYASLYHAIDSKGKNMAI